MTKSKIGPLMSRSNPHGRNQYSKHRSMTYAMIAVAYASGERKRPAHIRTKVSLDTEPVDSSLGNAILEAIKASGVQPTDAVVTVSFS